MHEHGRLKKQCKCWRAACICEHGRRKTDCKECGGSNICSGRVEKIPRSAGAAVYVSKHGRQELVQGVQGQK
jgi:hypothetical protein